MKMIIAKKSWFAESDLRMDAAYHLSDGQLTLAAFRKANIISDSLKNVTDRIFYGNRSRRVYVNNPEYGLPFIKGADIIKADFSTLKYISRKLTHNLNEYYLEEGWTLLTRSGTVGSTAYVNSDFLDKAASDDIIRVVPKKVLPGFLYAFLSSYYGKALLTSGVYGAVIQHIEPEHIENIPVPILPKEKQLQIHNLIIKSAKLHVDANKLLDDAKQQFDFIRYNSIKKKLKKSIRFKLISQNNRLNGNYYLSLGANFEEYILSLNNTFLGNCVNDIFTSGREKRNYSSKERGVPFLSNTDISSKNPFCSCNYMNSKHIGTKAVISNNMLLTGRVGQDTVGQVYFPHKFLIGSVASDNVIRIVVNDQIPKEYLFAFLSTEVGKEIIRRRKTGVGQPFITEEMLLSIPIPILDKNKILKIKNQICQYSFLIDTSFNIERQAIQLIEKEIDQWQN